MLWAKIWRITHLVAGLEISFLSWYLFVDWAVCGLPII